ncbi:MAG: hypothetical protein K8R25_08590 [Methanosarcinales archaeon]|jgi:hypothetical protein|nr:hypothetical protein [Methanosarcinales archaeon]
MKKLTEEEKNRLWEEVKEDFPDDDMMQEIHYVRLMHHYLTKNLSQEERFQFYSNLRKIQNI